MGKNNHIKCLGCDNVFQYELKGKRAWYRSKDDSISFNGENIKCPKCNGEKLIFDSYSKCINLVK